MIQSDIGILIFIHMEIDRRVAARQPVRYVLLHQIIAIAGGDESVRESWSRYLTDRNYIEAPYDCAYLYKYEN